MRTLRAVWVVGAVLAVSYGMALWAEDESRRRAARLPPAVTNTLHRLYPGAELRDTEEEGEGGERYFELEWRAADKRSAGELKVLPDGSLMESKEERELEAAPEWVRRALARAFPRGRISEARLVTRTLVTYEVDVREGERRREVTLSPRGKILEVENR